MQFYYAHALNIVNQCQVLRLALYGHIVLSSLGKPTMTQVVEKGQIVTVQVGQQQAKVAKAVNIGKL